MRNAHHQPGYLRIGALLCLASVILGGCSLLLPVETTSMNTFALDVQFEPVATGAGEATLLVSTPTARPGYDSSRMVYINKPHEIDYFSQNQWVDSPARMLTPLLVQALERSAQYRAVVSVRSAVTADLRLDTEIIRLQHEFLTRPSQVHLTVRAQLFDIQEKRVLATREFDVTEVAPGDDPYDGVIAANRAVKIMLLQIADFCALESKTAEPRSAPK